MGQTRNRLLLVMGVGILLVLAFARPAWRRQLAGATAPAAPESAALAAVTPTAAATVAPTAPPTATPFAFPPGSEVAGVDVGGLSAGAATERVTAALEEHRRAVTLRAPGYLLTMPAADFLELPSGAQLVERAQGNIRGSGPVKLPLQISVDRPALQDYVEDIAPRVAQPAATTVISDAKALTQTFTFTQRPGRALDVDRSVSAIARALEKPGASRRIELVVEPASAERPPMAELERVLRDHAAFWDGVAGFFVRDLATSETIVYNADTVFSGASVMKVPIMIFAYARLGELNDQQREWMRKMIIDSENLEANDLLAAAVGGQGTEAALQGVEEMTAMLKRLGLEYTYQLIPYESGEWLIQQSRLPGGGPPREGAAPYTAPDPYVRTTPREMGELFSMLDQCVTGAGPLLDQEKVGGTLTEELCAEMLDWLQKPHDQERMVAGLPPNTTIAHKGGWITDMQSDVGIVDSPGGRYVAAIYIWTNGYVTDEKATPSPYLGDFSHTIYTFFNPERIGEAEAQATPDN